MMVNRYKALSDETRLRILLLLMRQSLCVCQIQGVLGITQPNASKHLKKLKDLGAVRDERRDQFMYYVLNESDPILRRTLELIEEEAAMDPVTKSDFERLALAEQFLSTCGSLRGIEIKGR